MRVLMRVKAMPAVLTLAITTAEWEAKAVTEEWAATATGVTTAACP